MPNGTMHAAASILVGALGSTIGISHFSAPGPALAFAAGSLAGILLTPDLDLATGSISHQVMRRQAGCLAGGIWRLFWLPYSKLLHHRSALSHTPILGTLVRVIYLTWLPLIIWQLVLGTVRSVSNLPPPLILFNNLDALGWWVLVGLAASDLMHWAMDRSL